MLLGLGLVAVFVANGERRNRPPTPQQLEFADKLAHTITEVAKLAAECHARLPRESAESVGAIYARYSTKHQDSVVDQVRTIYEEAIRKKIFVPAENVFFDLGEKSYKSRRAGLDALRRCLAEKRAKVALFFSTSRMYRKMYMALQFVEEDVVGVGARAVFVKDRIDTAEGNRWSMLLNFNAAIDASYVGMFAEHIRAANEGLLLKQAVYSSVPFGYRGVPVDGEKTRRGTQRRVLGVDPDTGPWVAKIYDWFVTDGLSRADIVRRLNADPEAPKPPLAVTSRWSVRLLTYLLRNPRYRGEWSYGSCETVWQSKKEYARQVRRDKPIRTEQVEDLRLVPDAVWFKAQTLIERDVSRMAGRKPVDGDTTSRPRVLHKLFFCTVHDRPLYVAGRNGKSLKCIECQETDVETRPLFSQLCRLLALRRLCDVLAAKVRQDPDLVDALVTACQRAVDQIGRGDPGEVARLETRLGRLGQRIKSLLSNLGESEEDRAETESVLKTVRSERAALQAELEAAKAATARVAAIPTAADVRVLIDRMAEVLVANADGLRPEDAAEVRAVIDLLTGGRIDLEQVGDRRAYGGHLRGRFRLRLVRSLTHRLVGVPSGDDDSGEEVVIAFDRDYKRIRPEIRDRVVSLFQQGMLIGQIAEATGVSRKAVRETVVAWHVSHGLSVPDTYARRKELLIKQAKPTKAQVHADEVYAAVGRGETVVAVASRLDVSEPTVYDAWAFWHNSRGLSLVTIREFRKASRPEADAA